MALRLVNKKKRDLCALGDALCALQFPMSWYSRVVSKRNGKGNGKGKWRRKKVFPWQSIKRPVVRARIGAYPTPRERGFPLACVASTRAGRPSPLLMPQGALPILRVFGCRGVSFPRGTWMACLLQLMTMKGYVSFMVTLCPFFARDSGRGING